MTSRQVERESLRTASVCAKCGRQVEIGERVARLVVWGGYTVTNSYAYRVGNVCWNCLTPEQRHRWFEPCPVCGRPFSNQLERTRRSPYCSDRCAAIVNNEMTKAKRHALLAERECPVCHGRFKPKRKDQITCSNACRQRAYRQRPNQTAPRIAKSLGACDGTTRP